MKFKITSIIMCEEFKKGYGPSRQYFLQRKVKKEALAKDWSTEQCAHREIMKNYCRAITLIQSGSQIGNWGYTNVFYTCKRTIASVI